jgi:hypothetical protein
LAEHVVGAKALQILQYEEASSAFFKPQGFTQDLPRRNRAVIAGQCRAGMLILRVVAPGPL